MEAPSTQTQQLKQTATNGYAPVNGLNLYYEIHGKGTPLVLVHGGGSTIHTTFGRVLHLFAKSYMVVAVELQAHGHTADIGRPLSFEQDADDIAALLDYLHIAKAHFFGFSNGGNDVMQVAIRHPHLVEKLIISSAFYKRDGLPPQFWQGMENASVKNMPQQLKDAYLAVNRDLKGLEAMCNKDIQRMLGFKDWQDADLQSITMPAFVIGSDNDVMTPEHAVEMYRLLPHAQLAILPGGHGEYIGEITTPQNPTFIAATVSMLVNFLEEPIVA